jgi:RNA polymerase sigma-70 factor (ECF subfamily)
MFRRGRREAFEEVYRAYVLTVERYLTGLARGAGEMAQASAISDLVQEVFVRAFAAKGRQGYDGLRPYGAFLLGIARNCFFDARRARGWEVLQAPEKMPIDLEGEEPPCWSDPGVSRVLATFLAELPSTLQKICEGRFVLGQSQEEVSAALDLSRKQLRTAEKHLRRDIRRAFVHAGISPRELHLMVVESPSETSIAGR